MYPSAGYRTLRRNFENEDVALQYVNLGAPIIYASLSRKYVATRSTWLRVDLYQILQGLVAPGLFLVYLRGFYPRDLYVSLERQGRARPLPIAALLKMLLEPNPHAKLSLGFILHLSLNARLSSPGGQS